jgi:GAF domain-containing protein
VAFKCQFSARQGSNGAGRQNADATAAHPAFATDPYVSQRRARSVLCVPLIKQANPIGVLYVENNLTPRAFVPARIAVLKLLASQAAIALENARLYRDLTEREARIRRLVHANIIGIIIWELGGRILEANDAFLRIVGYDRGDLVSGRMRWNRTSPFSRWPRSATPARFTCSQMTPCPDRDYRHSGS